MNQDIRALTNEEIVTVCGGCNHGSGDCNGTGKGDGLGQLRQFEGALVDGLVSIARSIAGMF